MNRFTSKSVYYGLCCVPLAAGAMPLSDYQSLQRGRGTLQVIINNNVIELIVSSNFFSRVPDPPLDIRGLVQIA
jgi:hypothetical protein